MIVLLTALEAVACLFSQRQDTLCAFRVLRRARKLVAPVCLGDGGLCEVEAEPESLLGLLEGLGTNHIFGVTVIDERAYAQPVCRAVHQVVEHNILIKIDFDHSRRGLIKLW